MSKKKLNLFILSPLSLENGRGGEISSIELSSGLQKYYNIMFLDTNILIGKKLLSKEAINKKLNGLKKFGQFKFANLKIGNKNFDFPYPHEIIKFYKLIKKNDVVYTSYHNIKLSLILIFFSLIHRKARFIVGYRKPLYSDKLFSLYNIKYRLAILLFSIFKNRIYHHVLSRHAKTFLDKFYESSKVIHIIHGVNLENFNNNIIKPKEDILKFCYIGYLDDIHKGVGILLNAIEQILKENKDLKIFFEFCGMGPLEKQLMNLEKQFPQYIKFNGYISNENVHGYYQRNDIFLFSSRREPFPRAIMEALAAGLIILSSKTIGSIELLKGKNFAFFFDKLTSKEISEKIYEVYNLWLKNPAKIKELQKQAKNYVYEKYSISREIQMFNTLIKNIT